MTGASKVKDGDIVDVDKKGRRFFAVVTGRTGPVVGRDRLAVELSIRPLGRENYTTATPREVVGIYRKAKGSV